MCTQKQHKLWHPHTITPTLQYLIRFLFVVVWTFSIFFFLDLGFRWTYRKLHPIKLPCSSRCVANSDESKPFHSDLFPTWHYTMAISLSFSVSVSRCSFRNLFSGFLMKSVKIFSLWMLKGLRVHNSLSHMCVYVLIRIWFRVSKTGRLTDFYNLTIWSSGLFVWVLRAHVVYVCAVFYLRLHVRRQSEVWVSWKYLDRLCGIAELVLKGTHYVRTTGTPSALLSPGERTICVRVRVPVNWLKTPHMVPRERAPQPRTRDSGTVDGLV